MEDLLAEHSNVSLGTFPGDRQVDSFSLGTIFLQILYEEARGCGHGPGPSILKGTLIHSGAIY